MKTPELSLVVGNGIEIRKCLRIDKAECTDKATHLSSVDG